MRKHIIQSFLFAGIALAAVAQETESILKRNVIKITPQQFIRNTLQGSYERFSSDFKTSRQVSLGLLYRRDANSWSGGDSPQAQTGVFAEIQGRRYVPGFRQYTARRNNRMQAQGVYLSGFLRGEYIAINGEYSVWDTGTNLPRTATLDDRILAINPGFVIGYQRTLWQFVYLDLYVGGGLRLRM